MKVRPRKMVMNCAPGQLRGADGRCGPGVGVEIPRNDMPQIPENQLAQFIRYAKGKGVSVIEGKETASDLSPTQKEFRQERVDAMPESSLRQPLLTSSDAYILDGTHRWIKHWQRDKSSAVPVLKVGLPLHDALDLLRGFPGARFVANAAVTKKKKAKNPLRIDPTRTATLRRVATARVRRAFAILKGKLRKLLIDEDAFGLKERKTFAVNTFCPTGEGGGIDPTCSPSTGADKAVESYGHVDTRPQTEAFTDPHRMYAEYLVQDVIDSQEDSRTEEYGKSRQQRQTYAPGDHFGNHTQFWADDDAVGMVSVDSAYIPKHIDDDEARFRVQSVMGVKPNKENLARWGKPKDWKLRDKQHKLTGNEWNPDQPRDEAGKFTSGGTSATQTDSDKMPAVERLILRLAERKGEPGPFMKKVQAVEHYVADKIKSNFEKLPETVQTVVSGGIKTAFAGWTASQALAERVAIERGLNVEQAATVRGALAAADIVAFKPVGFLAGMAGPVASALSWVVPPTTGAYLLTSAATSPIKTLKAAHGLVRDAVRGVKEKVHGSGGLVATLNNTAVLDALTKAGYSDWWFALFTAACAEMDSVPAAIDLANTLFRRNPVTNAGRFAFHSTPEQIKAFQAWLRQQIAQHILSEKDKDEWQAYAEAGWKKGAGRAWDDANQKKLRKRKPELFTPEKQDELKGFYAGSKDEFLRSAFSQPVSVERIQVLASRTFDDLKNVTDDMTARLSRTLTDGLARGDSPLDVARELADDLNISRGRAETIARTEIIRAHAEGQLDAFEKMGMDKVGVEVEWLATDDELTCPECESMEGTIYSISDARGMIPAHPNCRCCLVPANVGEDDED